MHRMTLSTLEQGEWQWPTRNCVLTADKSSSPSLPFPRNGNLAIFKSICPQNSKHSMALYRIIAFYGRSGKGNWLVYPIHTSAVSSAVLIPGHVYLLWPWCFWRTLHFNPHIARRRYNIAAFLALCIWEVMNLLLLVFLSKDEIV